MTPLSNLSAAFALPYELWCQIFIQLHNPAIPSQSYPLCLVSRTFNALSDPIRFRSILLHIDFSESGLKQMETFLDGLIARTSERRVLRDLFLVVRNSQAESTPLSPGEIVRNRLSWMALHRKLSECWNGILCLTRHSLKTLTIYLGAYAMAPRIYKLTLPHLLELRLYISINQSHSTVFGHSSDSSLSIFNAPSKHPTFPSLRTLNLIYPGGFSERHLANSIIRNSPSTAPALDLLKLRADHTSLPSLDILRLSLGAKLGRSVNPDSSRFEFPQSLRRIEVEAVFVVERVRDHRYGYPAQLEENLGEVGLFCKTSWRGEAEGVVDLEEAKFDWNDKVLTK
ncbi:hypothetical protein JAAARDRAFT_428820 [Jaapia argillacea MUCL 33604]|uniref:F-box domain-containing protein n=1 Tax=Jaapia argillacea MUCL 33604 TaxID=933084 RepID=A0A067PQH6_9AGAM|nr:hypothetical protein JAAARDRAFT_428820 [Jaapia argillacea MUCL 33604]